DARLDVLEDGVVRPAERQEVGRERGSPDPRGRGAADVVRGAGVELVVAEADLVAGGKVEVAPQQIPLHGRQILQAGIRARIEIEVASQVRGERIEIGRLHAGDAPADGLAAGVRLE